MPACPYACRSVSASAAASHWPVGVSGSRARARGMKGIMSELMNQ